MFWKSLVVFALFGILGLQAANFVSFLNVHNSTSQVFDESIDALSSFKGPSPIIELDEEVNSKPSDVKLVEVNSSPAEIVLAKVPSPIDGLSYELNEVKLLGENKILARWKVKNDTSKNIAITQAIRNATSPTKLRVANYRSQNVLTLSYEDQIPLANCLLADNIPAYGRVECSAQLGGQVGNSPLGIEGQIVSIYFPGISDSIRLILNS